jgi:hypothetical protein
MKNNSVIIDYDIRGWGNDNEKSIQKKYKMLIIVGIHKSFPQDAPDKKIGAYANRYKCDILTSDKTAHVEYFKNKAISSVEIQNYAYDKKASKPIYLIKLKKK